MVIACMLASMFGECLASLQRPIKALVFCCLGRFSFLEGVLSSSGLDLNLDLDFSSHRDVRQAPLTAVHSLIFLPSYRIVIFKASLLAIKHWFVNPGRNFPFHTIYWIRYRPKTTAFAIVAARPLDFSGRQKYYRFEGP